MNQFSNTYLCSSDNYFIENPFNTYEYHSYYSAEYAAGKTDEYCLSTDKNGLITRVSVGGENTWYMIGHVYFDRNFSQKFIELFRKDYERTDIKEKLWEDFYIEHFKLANWFDTDKIVYSDGKIKGKPAPDIYQIAAEKLGLAPLDCVVVEDAVSGIEAAKAASIGKIVAIASMEPVDLYKNIRAVDLIIKDFSNFEEILSPKKRICTV